MKYFDSDEVQKIGEALGLKGTFIKDWGTGHILSIVCPSPQVETVEVKQWVVIDTATGTQGTYLKQSIAQACAINAIVVELTGSYEREVKRKVKMRRELGTFSTGYFAYRSDVNKGIPDDAKLIFEWEE